MIKTLIKYWKVGCMVVLKNFYKVRNPFKIETDDEILDRLLVNNYDVIKFYKTIDKLQNEGKKSTTIVLNNEEVTITIL